MLCNSTKMTLGSKQLCIGHSRCNENRVNLDFVLAGTCGIQDGQTNYAFGRDCSLQVVPVGLSDRLSVMQIPCHGIAGAASNTGCLSLPHAVVTPDEANAYDCRLFSVPCQGGTNCEIDSSTWLCARKTFLAPIFPCPCRHRLLGNLLKSSTT